LICLASICFCWPYGFLNVRLWPCSRLFLTWRCSFWDGGQESSNNLVFIGDERVGALYLSTVSLELGGRNWLSSRLKLLKVLSGLFCWRLNRCFCFWIERCQRKVAVEIHNVWLRRWESLTAGVLILVVRDSLSSLSFQWTWRFSRCLARFAWWSHLKWHRTVCFLGWRLNLIPWFNRTVKLLNYTVLLVWRDIERSQNLLWLFLRWHYRWLSALGGSWPLLRRYRVFNLHEVFCLYVLRN